MSMNTNHILGYTTQVQYSKASKTSVGVFVLLKSIATTIFKPIVMFF